MALDREQALQALARSKRQMRGLRSWIEQIHAGTIEAPELETVLLRHVAAAFSKFSATDARDAYLRLLLHVEHRAPDLLSTAWGCDRYGPRRGNTLVDGLAALALLHKRWTRDPQKWRLSWTRLRRSRFHRHLQDRHWLTMSHKGLVQTKAGPHPRRQKNWSW